MKIKIFHYQFFRFHFYIIISDFISTVSLGIFLAILRMLCLHPDLFLVMMSCLRNGQTITSCQLADYEDAFRISSTSVGGKKSKHFHKIDTLSKSEPAVENPALWLAGSFAFFNQALFPGLKDMSVLIVKLCTSVFCCNLGITLWICKF